jgi:hypothetical protein
LAKAFLDRGFSALRMRALPAFLAAAFLAASGCPRSAKTSLVLPSPEPRGATGTTTAAVLVAASMWNGMKSERITLGIAHMVSG